MTETLTKEEKEQWRASHTVTKVIGRHPSAPFTSFVCQCKKCLLIETVDARRNGVPGGLQLLLPNRIEAKGSMVSWSKKLVHAGCGGRVGIFGRMPEHYHTLY